LTYVYGCVKLPFVLPEIALFPNKYEEDINEKNI